MNMDISAEDIMKSWEKELNKSEPELCVIYGKLLALKHLKSLIEMLQESYTAVLCNNGLKSDQDCEDLVKPKKEEITTEKLMTILEDSDSGEESDNSKTSIKTI